MNNAAVADVSERTSAATILQRAVCLTLTCSYLGNNRKVPLEKLVEVSGGTKELEERHFHATMRLIDPKKLTPCSSVIGRAKQFLRSIAIPTPRVFGERSYLVPSACAVAVDARLGEFQSELAYEALKLSEVYTQAIAEQAVALGPMFNATLYATPTEVARAFRMDWNFVSFAAPENLETVDRALFAATQQKYQVRMAEAYDEVKLVLRDTLRQLVADIAFKLSPTADGKPRVFRGTILKDMTDFLATFDLRNIADDAELAGVVRALKGLTTGIDPDGLRDFAVVRDRVRIGMQVATDRLDELVATGRRGISFGALTSDD